MLRQLCIVLMAQNVNGEEETQIQSPDNIQHLRLFCDKCFYKYIFNISY
jgi:hypothetical protein